MIPMMDGYWGNGGLWMMLFWILVIAGVVGLVLALSSRRERRGEDCSALRLLEERLARGDIDTEDYRTRRELIEESGGRR